MECFFEDVTQEER